MVESKREDMDELKKEVAYLRRLVESDAARMLTVDVQSIAIRHELEQKRRGFRLMAELAVTLNQDADYKSVFVSISRRINATLSMQRTAVLFPVEKDEYKALVLHGYAVEEKEAVINQRIAIPADALDPLHPLLITGADPIEKMGDLRRALLLPYLIAAPVIVNNQIAAILVTGRLLEQNPYLPRLGTSDVETVQTVGAYLAAILAEHRLRQVENLAKHDPLTQLPNLRGTSESLHHTLAIARRGGFHAAAMFVDLDGFKAVNDTYGHAAGDMVLQIVGERFMDNVRESDSVGRIGGDEFLVILSHIRRPEDAAFVARKIIDSVSEPINACGAVCQIGASVGIAIFPDHGGDASTLIRAADEAMYSVKSKGKNSYAFARR